MCPEGVFVGKDGRQKRVSLPGDIVVQNFDQVLGQNTIVFADMVGKTEFEAVMAEEIHPEAPEISLYPDHLGSVAFQKFFLEQPRRYDQGIMLMGYVGTALLSEVQNESNA